MKNRFAHYFIIGTFVSLYLIVSAISTVHVVNFFELSNPRWLAISLALAFEIGAAASLSSLVILDKTNRFLVWFLFIVLTIMQAMGNTYYAYTHLGDFRYWSELFGISEEDVIFQKRLLSIISGAILPVVSLGFIKSLVDYITPNVESTEGPIKITKDEKSEAESPVEYLGNLENVTNETIPDKLNETLAEKDIDAINTTSLSNPDFDVNQWAPENIEPVNTNRKPRLLDPISEYKSRIRK